MAVLETHQLTADASITEGFAECTTGLYQPGSPRNHDLLLFGKRRSGSFALGIEAKADEPLDSTLNEKLICAAKRIRANRPTGLPERIKWLLQSVLGCRCDIGAYRRRVMSGLTGSPSKWDFSEFFSAGDKPDPALANLRCQLLTGLAGTVIETACLERAVAVFVIYEFRTEKTDDDRLALNAADIQAFCSRIFGVNSTPIEFGKLYGPINLPTVTGIPRPFPAVPVLIGKIRVDSQELLKLIPAHSEEHPEAAFHQ